MPKEETGVWGPQREDGVWSSQGGEEDKLFFLHSLLSHMRLFFFLSFFKPGADDYTTKQLSLNSVLRIVQQQCILLEDNFSFLRTFCQFSLSVMADSL